MLNNFVRDQYREILPPEELKDYIKYLWFYKHNGDDFEFNVLPDACFDLVLDFEDDVLQNIFLTGIWTTPKELTVTKGTTLFAIRFKLISAEYLFRKEVKELLETMTVLPIDFWDIKDRCATNNFESFSKSILDFLAKTIGEIQNIDYRKLKLFDLIYNKKQYKVSEISQELDWSPRQINRYFNNQFGFPLKVFILMARCQNYYKDIANGILYPSDKHSDQAHFIKEIKKYTNKTPKQLYKNENDRFIQLSPLKKG